MPSSTMVYNLQPSIIPKHHAYWHAVRFCLLCVTNPGQGYQSSPTTLAVIHAVWALQSVLTLGHFDHIPKIGICIAIVVVVVAWSDGTAASPRSDREGQHIPSGWETVFDSHLIQPFISRPAWRTFPTGITVLLSGSQENDQTPKSRRERCIHSFISLPSLELNVKINAFCWKTIAPGHDAVSRATRA